jgi:hypothetical protein
VGDPDGSVTSGGKITSKPDKLYDKEKARAIGINNSATVWRSLLDAKQRQSETSKFTNTNTTNAKRHYTASVKYKTKRKLGR